MQLICGALERIVFHVIHKSDEKSLTVNSETVLCNVSSMRRSVPLPDEILRRELKIRRAAEYFNCNLWCTFSVSYTTLFFLNWYTHKRDIFSPKPTRLVQTLFATVHYLPDEILQSFVAFQYKPSPFCNSWIATVYPSTDYVLIAVTRTFFKSDKRWNSYLTSIRSWPSKVECYCAESY